MYNQEFTERIRKLKSEKARIEKIISSTDFPDGTLQIAKNGTSYKWYVVHYPKGKRTRTYLPKSERETARKLALKKYYYRELSAINNEISATQSYLKNIPQKLPNDLFINNPVYIDLLKNDVSFLKNKLSDWENAPYEHNNNYPERLIVNTMRGDLVRSKSEAMIADALYRNNIPYRYECALNFPSGITIFPDFTILSPSDGHILVWEHFGLMDNREYIANYSKKLETYAESGYIPNKNLIMTFEDSMNPISLVEINKVIKNFFDSEVLY